MHPYLLKVNVDDIEYTSTLEYILYPEAKEKEATVTPKVIFRDMPTAMRIGFIGPHIFIPDEGAVVFVKLSYLYATKPEGESRRRGSSVGLAIAEQGTAKGRPEVMDAGSSIEGTLGGGAVASKHVVCMASVVRPSKTSPKFIDWVLPPIQRTGYWGLSCSFNGHDFSVCGRVRVHEQSVVAYMYPRKLNMRSSTDVVIGCEVPQAQIDAVNKLGETSVKIHVSGTAEGHNTSMTVLQDHQRSPHPAVDLLGIEGVGADFYSHKRDRARCEAFMKDEAWRCITQIDLSVLGATIKGNGHRHQPVYFIISCNGLSVLLSSTPKPEEEETHLLLPVVVDGAGDAKEEAAASEGVVALAGALLSRSGLTQKGNNISGAKETNHERRGVDGKTDNKVGENSAKSDDAAGERTAASKESIEGNDDIKHKNTGEKEEAKELISKTKAKAKFKAISRVVKAVVGMDKKDTRIGMYSLLPISKMYLTDIATRQYQDVTAEVRMLHGDRCSTLVRFT